MILLADIPYPSKTHEMSGLAAGVVFYFRARLVDKSGNQSKWTEFVQDESEFDASSIIDEISERINDTEAVLENAKGLNGNAQYFMYENGKMKVAIVPVDNYVVTETKALAPFIRSERRRINRVQQYKTPCRQSMT